MASFRNALTGVVVSVADTKDGRFTQGWEPVKDDKPAPAPAPPAKKTVEKR